MFPVRKSYFEKLQSKDGNINLLISLNLIPTVFNAVIIIIV